MYSCDIPATSGIYRIVCVPTGKLYIGSAVDLQSRRREHFHGLRQNKHHSITLQRAFNKYGEEAFLFEVIELVLPPFLISREQHYLDILKPFGSKGYNIDRVAGSRYGSTHTPEAREKLRQANLGKKHTEETKLKQAAVWTGRTHSKETREKLSAMGMGHPVSDEARANMRTAQLGKKQSKATIEKRRNAMIGHEVSEETRNLIRTSQSWRMQTIIVTFPDGTEQTVTGVNKFCQDHALSYSNLMNVAKGKARATKGYKARFP